jgi:hypothetical protein
VRETGNEAWQAAESLISHAWTTAHHSCAGRIFPHENE